ncbi:DUF4136 domain-containing protein [Zunongwangia sp. H14]|uniref:DUF4136 domain-containing protein n=1 Tax=Zunongwangia sp. H14 TaxID=3240792 RepID=UPI003563B86F
MKNFKTTLICAMLLLAFACGPRVRTVNPESSDLSSYETFAYLPNTNAEVPGKAYNDESVNQTIIEAINNNMQQEGYELERNEPDLLVLVSTKTDTEVETTTDPVYATYPYSAGMGSVSPYYNNYYYYGYNNYNGVVGYDTDTYSYKEGTLIINLVDRQTKNTVWKGIASDAVYDQTSRDAIRGMVDDIFEEYPLKN